MNYQLSYSPISEAYKIKSISIQETKTISNIPGEKMIIPDEDKTIDILSVIKLKRDDDLIDEIIQERERLGLKQILPATIIGHLVKCYQEIDLAELREILEISKEFVN